jgi:hypothetical protein
MRLKSALVALSLCLAFLLPRVAFADTLTLTGATGGSTDGIYVYPYEFTVTGPGGTEVNTILSCLNFDREISFGETWTVDAINLSTIDPTSTYDGELGADYLEDAWLFNQYGTAAGTDSEIQFAIWSIMDPSAVNASNPSYNGPNAFDATAQALAAQAIGEVTGSDPLPASYFLDNVVFVPDASDSASWTDSQPQIFMSDPPPPAVTSEPSSLMMFGTGLLGAVGILRSKARKAEVRI